MAEAAWQQQCVHGMEHVYGMRMRTPLATGRQGVSAADVRRPFLVPLSSGPAD
jgi:hypothetical protein